MKFWLPNCKAAARACQEKICIDPSGEYLKDAPL